MRIEQGYFARGDLTLAAGGEVLTQGVQLRLNLCKRKRSSLVGNITQVTAGACEVALFHDAVRGAACHGADPSELLR